MSIKHQIPNTLTTLNLISGLVSITLAFQQELVWASVLIFFAAIFDYFDGMLARLLGVYSDLGKQLDSLADLVSFGVAPALIMFQLLFMGCEGSCNILEQYHLTPYFALLIPVCSAFRLAKFNIDTLQEENFIGLATPANALFFASIPLILFIQPESFTLIPFPFMERLFSNTRVLSVLTVIFSWLLISDIRFFGLKFKSASWRGNEFRYLFLIMAALLLFLFSFAAIPLIIGLYLFVSLIVQNKLTEH